MKPPYVDITAECVRHGLFRTLRKPNKNTDPGNGKNRAGLYDAVKCPKCPYWAKIVTQIIITGTPTAEQPDQQGVLL